MATTTWIGRVPYAQKRGTSIVKMVTYWMHMHTHLSQLKCILLCYLRHRSLQYVVTNTEMTGLPHDAQASVWYLKAYVPASVSQLLFACCDKLSQYSCFLNQVRAGHRPACAWFLQIDPVRIVSMYVFACVCVRPQGYYSGVI